MRLSFAVNTWLRCVLTLSLGWAPFAQVPAYADGSSCEDNKTQVLDRCSKMQAAGTAASNAQIGAAKTDGTNVPGAAAGLADSSNSGAQIAGTVSGVCAKLKDSCQNSCDPKSTQDQKTVKDCVASLNDTTNKLNQSADVLKQAAVQSKDTGTAAGGGGMGGLGSMGTALIGAVGGGLLGYMMGQQAQKKQDQNAAAAALAQQPVQTLGALQANGTLDCSRYDSYQFTDCTTYLETACANSAVTANTQLPGMIPLANGQIVSSASASQVNCPAFNASFCSAQVAPSQPVANLLPNGGMAQLNMGGSGGGLGSPYCMNSQASAYCTNPAYAAIRQQCPSCTHLATTTSATCVANPAACMAQDSNATIAQARATCPDDPVFSNPASPYLLSTGAVLPSVVPATSVPAVMPVAAAGGGVPAVVLPQSVKSQKANSTVAKGLAPASANNGTASAPGVAGGGIREGQTGLAMNSSSTATSFSSSGGGYVPSSVGGGSKTLNAAVGIRTASARGPASDVQGQYGPSLFASTTQVIRMRCQAGKLNNCP